MSHLGNDKIIDAQRDCIEENKILKKIIKQLKIRIENLENEILEIGELE